MDSEITESAAGVRLTKYSETEAYEVPSVVYEFTSRHPEPVEVFIEDSLPRTLDSDDVGFHPNYGGKHWLVRDGTLEFERELEPESTYTTVVGIDDDTDLAGVSLLSPPDTFEVEGTDRGVVVSPSSGSFTRSGSPYENPSDGGPTSTPEPGESVGPGVQGSSIDDGLDSETPGRASPEEADRGNADAPADGGETVGAALIAELEAGTLSEETVQTLRDQLRANEPARGSVEARIEQLQRDFSELRAYKNALAEFLDEEGSASDLIDRFERDLESIEESVDEIEARTETQAEDLESITVEVDEQRDEFETLTQTLESVRTEVEDLQTEVGQLRDTVPESDVDERLTAVEEDVGRVTTVIDGLNEAFGNSTSETE